MFKFVQGNTCRETRSENGGKKEDIQPRVIVGHVEDKPAFIAPLGLKLGHGTSRLVWLADQWNDYNAPIVCRNALARLP